MLVNGIWKQNWQPVQSKDEQGRFIRQRSVFRNWITVNGSPGPTGKGGFQAEKGRYHLYVAYICPWASRTLMVRKLKKLENLITFTVVNPRMTDQGWQFGGYPGSGEDKLNGTRYLHQLYTDSDPNYTGRATVPVLWDKQQGCIVNNESADIIRMLNTAFSRIAEDTINLYPESRTAEIDNLNRHIYDNLNNGVYQAGFATSQKAYEEAYSKVFSTLDELNELFSDGRPFLLGDQLTETDVRLFVTLIRFDAAYHGLFKCNRNMLKEMPRLDSYTRRVLALDGIRETVNFDHIKAGYYSIKALNPGGIVPLGPDLDGIFRLT